MATAASARASVRNNTLVLTSSTTASTPARRLWMTTDTLRGLPLLQVVKTLHGKQSKSVTRGTPVPSAILTAVTTANTRASIRKNTLAVTMTASILARRVWTATTLSMTTVMT